MAYLQPLPRDRVSPELQAVYDEIQQAYGMVPNLFKTAAHHPPLLKANWEKVKGIMTGGQLPRPLKESIALLVSKDNGCQYCIRAHTQALKALRVSEAEIEALYQERFEATGYGDKAVTLIRLARWANSAPNDMPGDAFRKAQDAGATEAEIVEALGVMEVFAAFNKFLDAVAVEIDF
ncbi:MAG: peroxidase [Cyanobacteria bacterium QS_8_64_29]|nr:MAG: peroxidase [Cyanobacteria bacterium QS_8_64_29]